MLDLANTPIGLALRILVGAVIGSFVVTCAMRMSAQRSWVGGRSQCDHCRAPLSYAATLPLLGYASAGGRCRHCEGRIDPLHPLGEAAGAMIMMTALGSPAQVLLLAGLGFCLLFICVFDLKTFRIPNAASLVVLLLGAAEALRQDRVLTALATAASVWLLLTLLRVVYRCARGKDGLGGGDIKLLAACACWVGPQVGVWALLIATALAMLWVKARRIPPSTRVAFAPFIAVGVWSTAWLWSAR